jgi:DnaJ-class molecular chaperone
MSLPPFEELPPLRPAPRADDGFWEADEAAPARGDCRQCHGRGYLIAGTVSKDGKEFFKVKIWCETCQGSGGKR